ncbi:MAG: pseudouridine-5'-phosphate glycosidase [Isosphaeraceae bacterium]
MQPEALNELDLTRADSGVPASVILESSLIVQGLPWPDNLETVLEMEEAVRGAGGMPATIAIMHGVVRIGLTPDEIEAMARQAAPSRSPGEPPAPEPGSRFSKANRRDLSAVLSKGGNAATTVSATLWLGRTFGPNPCVMATGGLGGVHPGAGAAFDVSTDLDELARADGCAVVCSGFKSILDLPATLESLETRGVPVVGYRTDELPAFTGRSSGLKLEHRVDTPAQAARLIRVHRKLGLPGAVVLTHPVPTPDAIRRELEEAALTQALDEARRRGIAGKALTPFLLEAMRGATGGMSLRANRALLVANARVAAEIAVALKRDPSGSADESR